MKTHKHLTAHEKSFLKHNDISPYTYNKRINQGWDEDDALFLPSTYRNMKGEITHVIYDGETPYHLHPEHFYKMTMKGLEDRDILRRIRNGATVDEAVQDKRKESKYDLTFEQRLKQQMSKEYKSIRVVSDLREIPYHELLFQQTCKQFLEAN